MRLLILIILILCTGCAHKSRQVYYRLPPSQPIPQAEPYYYVPPVTAPIQKASTQAAASPLIMIDPGHGGDDEGTKSLTKPIYSEKSFNLTTAKLLSNYLSQMGYRTTLTRTDDQFISLKNRYELANKEKPALFISVHFNAASSPDAHGIEVFYFKSDENKSRTLQSKELAQTVLAEVILQTHAKSRGTKHGNYAVIRETEVPAILIEGGFLSNDDELAKIKDPSYLKKIAFSIATATHKYLSN